MGKTLTFLYKELIVVKTDNGKWPLWGQIQSDFSPKFIQTSTVSRLQLCILLMNNTWS